LYAAGHLQLFADLSIAERFVEAAGRILRQAPDQQGCEPSLNELPDQCDR
jgi:hypothetical protein